MSHVNNRIKRATPRLGGDAATALFDRATDMEHPSPGSLKFALLSQSSRAVEVRSDEAIGPLLAAATVTHDCAVHETHSIWTSEALHRAYATLKLFLILHRSRRRIDCVTRVLERNLAIDLACKINALTHSSTVKSENCAKALRDIVSGLVALFGPGIGDLDVETDISEVRLSGQRRRALTLLIHELVVNALMHAFAGRRRGRIVVTIRLALPGVAALSVMDDGIGISDDAIAAGSIAASLARVLGSDLYYRRTLSGFTKIESVFKVEEREASPSSNPPFVHTHKANANDERSFEAGRLWLRSTRD
jgi:hypothetical protein